MYSHLRIPPQPEHVPVVRDCVCDTARTVGVDDEAVSQVARHVTDAVSEAVRLHRVAAERPPVVVSYGADGNDGFTVAVGAEESPDVPAVVAFPLRGDAAPNTGGPLASPPAAPLSEDAGACTLALMPGPARVPQARKFVVALLYAQGHDKAAPVAEVVVSELVTNTLIHTAGGATLTAVAAGGRVRVDVCDASLDPPELIEPADDGAVGRGLLMVEALSSKWGWTELPGGKAVWFELDGSSSI